MFEFEAYEVLKTKEFTYVNDCFQNKHNEKIGHYRQTLINLHNHCMFHKCTKNEIQFQSFGFVLPIL